MAPAFRYSFLLCFAALTCTTVQASDCLESLLSRFVRGNLDSDAQFTIAVAEDCGSHATELELSIMSALRNKDAATLQDIFDRGAAENPRDFVHRKKPTVHQTILTWNVRKRLIMAFEDFGWIPQLRYQTSMPPPPQTEKRRGLKKLIGHHRGGSDEQHSHPGGEVWLRDRFCALVDVWKSNIEALSRRARDLPEMGVNSDTLKRHMAMQLVERDPTARPAGLMHHMVDMVGFRNNLPNHVADVADFASAYYKLRMGLIFAVKGDRPVLAQLDAMRLVRDLENFMSVVTTNLLWLPRNSKVSFHVLLGRLREAAEFYLERSETSALKPEYRKEFTTVYDTRSYIGQIFFTAEQKTLTFDDDIV